MLTLTKLNLFDIVALKNDLPQYRLLAGQVGTIVEILAPEVYEVEFSDDDGQTYATQALPADQLLKLHYKPMPNSISNNIHQYGSGDNIAGDKILGDKIGNQYNNNLQGANIANFANEVKDSARQQASHFNQTSGTSTAEILELINKLRQTADQFPPEVREELIIDVEDVEVEIQKPEAERNIPKLRKRLLALLTAATVTFNAIAGMTDFANNVMEIGSKVGIELIKK
ncbi:MAG: DUF4926 domain-containing protein [Pseudanabaenaceae cyanobacterium bins.39]|nr:DUF4926 domain-containing protein [Pseudanabaenaceae cyanobacterium bins.39]